MRVLINCNDVCFQSQYTHASNQWNALYVTPRGNVILDLGPVHTRFAVTMDTTTLDVN